MFLETICMSVLSHITLALMIIQLCPFLDLEIHIKSLTLPNNSKPVQHLQMKLGTHVPRNNLHVYTQPNNSARL